MSAAIACVIVWFIEAHNPSHAGWLWAAVGFLVFVEVVGLFQELGK